MTEPPSGGTAPPDSQPYPIDERNPRLVRDHSGKVFASCITREAAIAVSRLPVLTDWLTGIYAVLAEAVLASRSKPLPPMTQAVLEEQAERVRLELARLHGRAS